MQLTGGSDGEMGGLGDLPWLQVIGSLQGGHLCVGRGDLHRDTWCRIAFPRCRAVGERGGLVRSNLAHWKVCSLNPVNPRKIDLIISQGFI